MHSIASGLAATPGIEGVVGGSKQRTACPAANRRGVMKRMPPRDRSRTGTDTGSARGMRSVPSRSSGKSKPARPSPPVANGTMVSRVATGTRRLTLASAGQWYGGAGGAQGGNDLVEQLGGSNIGGTPDRSNVKWGILTGAAVS